MYISLPVSRWSIQASHFSVTTLVVPALRISSSRPSRRVSASLRARTHLKAARPPLRPSGDPAAWSRIHVLVVVVLLLHVFLYSTVPFSRAPNGLHKPLCIPSCPTDILLSCLTSDRCHSPSLPPAARRIDPVLSSS